MADTSQGEVQTAMYNILVPSGTIDSTLTGLGVQGVYDWMSVPQNAPFDYITLGDGYELPSDTLGTAGHSDGFLLYAMIHVWSRQRNTANPSAMINRLNTLLHRQPLTLATLTHVYTLKFRCTWLPDPSGIMPVLHIANQYLVYTVQS